MNSQPLQRIPRSLSIFLKKTPPPFLLFCKSRGSKIEDPDEGRKVLESLASEA